MGKRVEAGVGVAAWRGGWAAPSTTGVLADTRGSDVTGADAEAQAKTRDNINPDKPSFRAATGRLRVLRMTSGSFPC